MMQEAAPTYPHLAVERDKDVLRVWLNRPEVHNALNGETMDSLRRCIQDAAAMPDVRVVVIGARGRTFCAGADLNWMQAALSWTFEENVADALRLADMLEAIENCPKPVIARVNGSAFAGGIGVIAACDIAIAVREARFSLTEVRLGIVPAIISPYVIRKIGQGHARALFITGEAIDAERARELGLIHKVVDADGLDAAVENVIGHIRRGGPRAVEAAKRLALEVPRMDPAAVRRYTAELIASLRVSDEGQAGIRAFLERRLPPWVEP